ncbi:MULTISPECIES: hypothetical protein [Lactococcus]|uniref:Uncharacterized protein n=1 Tax=Lactococcus petauri TaxID=1940789 RepID=A0AAJ2MRV5_9LACT|nr:MULTISPECIES: hypothetical protein [Lactococcus]MBD5823638.1 hypothetical protein [Lactococcus petauri]MDC0826269.1 hypothetical protein [Lactococcus petauri]MDT2526869.1 hypothetical protein [Lactococcus petauri]MDT2541414.1 hypothetical protein [Lactococcus petauri]MDT2558099.1 hypothetical protein [Lactococcus petauri]
MKKANKRASKITYLFVCGFVLLSFSLAGPKAQTVSEAAEIMNPLSPDDKVIPQEPEPITVPPASEEEKAQTPPKKSEAQGDRKEERQKKQEKKKKIFFAPDTTVALEQSQKIRILDGDTSTSTTTGKVLSIMSGRLLFGSK